MFISNVNKKAKDNPLLFVKACEDEFNLKIKTIVKYIETNEIRFVFLSGPTSSGKTTFAKKFAEYMVKFRHFDISLDDYYKPFSDMPLKKDGDYNFESVNSLRLSDIKRDFYKLKNGEEVMIPLVDFETGKRTESNEKIKLSSDTVVIIEGLHALNTKITDIFEDEKTLKIFICPIPEIELKDKKISKYDLRFIRRMVRDNNFRKSGPENSLRMWSAVRDGEKIYMDGYRKNADFIMNTFLPYELCALKNEALNLLSLVEKGTKHENKIRRLTNLLNEFYPISYELIPENSLLNEFIKKD